LDVTSYRDGKRETHNPTGRAHAPVVWDYYEVLKLLYHMASSLVK